MLRQIAALAVLLAGPPAFAQQVQPWPDVLVSGSPAGKWLASGEVIGRIADDSRTSQLETRLQLGNQITKRVAVWVGWVHFANYVPKARNSVENQAVEQLNWTLRPIGKLRLATRTRLEQRFISNVTRTSWRLRQQVRAVLPLGSPRAPSAVLWTEPFLALNRTPAQRHTLDQLRTFAGLSLPLTKRIDVEFGYLNQRLYWASGTLVNHAVPLIVTVRL